MNAFREDLQALVTRHVARAPASKILRLVEVLDEPEEISFGAVADVPRFALLGADGRQCGPGDQHVATYDALTNLTWLAGQCDCGEVPWELAMKKAREVRLFGLTDWRPPTIQEQLSIIDYTRCDPAVDPSYFKGPYDWTWTSTPAASPSDYAWGVHLNDGFSDRNPQSLRSHVRAVRAGQPLALGL